MKVISDGMRVKGLKERLSFNPFPCIFLFPVLRCAAFLFVVVALDIRV